MIRKRKAMIMAAGTGTRLLPLTQNKPKALVEFRGKSLLQITIEKLKKYGFTEIIINLHHFPDMIKDYLNDNDNFGVSISFSDETDELLETGGGLKKAAWFFDSGPFLVHNVDVMSDLNINELFDYHLEENNIASLAVMSRETSRPLLMNEDHILCGWRNTIRGEKIIVRKINTLKPVGFSGIYVLDPVIFELMTETGMFSITPVLLRLAREHNISLFLHQGEWMDMGKPGSSGS